MPTYFSKEAFEPSIERQFSINITDFYFQVQDDIQTSSRGDLKTITNAALIKSALLRRVSTPVAGYRRWVRSVDGLVEIDSDYGDELFFYLSAPITSLNIQKIQQAVKRSAAADNRIEIIDVKAEVYPSRSQVYLKLKYIIKSDASLQELEVSLASQGEELSVQLIN